LIGLFPSGIQPGDIVCVFFGASVPYVLRTVGGESTDGFYRVIHQLVGPCYVHGIMDGEALDGFPKQEHFIIK
jgi:hypothetical protein